MLPSLAAAAGETNAVPAEALPKQRITALEVVPPRIAIHGRFESAQVLVNARLATGEVADVTRLAKLQVGSSP
jgi:hypothetical protein